MLCVSGHAVTDHIVWELSRAGCGVSAKQRLKKRTAGSELEALVVHCEERLVAHKHCAVVVAHLVLMDGAYNLFPAVVEATLLQAMRLEDRKIEAGWRVTISDYEVVERGGSRLEAITWVIVNSCSFARQREHFCGSDRIVHSIMQGWHGWKDAPCCFGVAGSVVKRVLTGEMVLNCSEGLDSSRGRGTLLLQCGLVRGLADVRFRFEDGVELHVDCPGRSAPYHGSRGSCHCGQLGGFRRCLGEMYPPNKVNAGFLFRILRGHPHFLGSGGEYESLPYAEKMLVHHTAYCMTIPHLQSVPVCLERVIGRYIMGEAWAGTVTPTKGE